MVSNCSLSSPLSQSQKVIWSLTSLGLSVSKIAEKLKTTRQYVNQTLLTAQAKVSSTLLEVAQVNDIQITKIYPKKAILLGYHPVLKRKAIITYTTSHGLKVWYWHDNPEEVNDQEVLSQTKQYLVDIARERGLELGETTNVHPAKLAQTVFSLLIPELKT